METEQPKVVSKQFIHSCHIKNKYDSAVIVKEKIKYDDGSIKPNVRLIQNPKRSFYITQKRYRTYRYKPEYELLSRLDKYTVLDHQLNMKVADLFQLGNGYVSRDKLFKSPYIFGADISIEALIKMWYIDNYPDQDTDMQASVGFFDIETSIDTGEIIVISYIHDNIVHTAIMKSFLFEEIKGVRVPVSKEDMLAHIQINMDKMGPKVQELNLTYNIAILDTEMQLIAWILRQVHLSQTDFIGIWNMHFDIPKVLDTITKHKHDAASLFADPSIPSKFRYLRYYEDKRKVQHFTLKWHWLYSACGSQFYDAMGLYSQCRRTAGYLDKYDLNSVLTNEVGLGKLPLTDDSHVIMQRHHFKDYVVYNIFDVVGIRLLENKNQDVLSMSVLIGPTPVSRFSASTTRATNSLYHTLIAKGQVLSSCSNEDEFVKFDRLVSREGGAVLPPARVQGVGIFLDI